MKLIKNANGLTFTNFKIRAIKATVVINFIISAKQNLLSKTCGDKSNFLLKYNFTKQIKGKIHERLPYKDDKEQLSEQTK